MQVGDLVTCEFGCNDRPSETCLSEYNSGDCKGYIGIVIKIHLKKNCMYPIVVSWFGYGQMALLRSALKFVSKI